MDLWKTQHFIEERNRIKNNECCELPRQDVETLQEQQRQAEELKLAEEEKRRLQLERRKKEIEEEKRLIEEVKQEQEEVLHERFLGKSST